MRVPGILDDALSSRPVFVAPDRAGRPGDYGDAAIPLGGPARCPFCAGNESLTPPEVLRAPPAAPALPGGGPWRARIVPNRFPFVHDPAAKNVVGDVGDSIGGNAAENASGTATAHPAAGPGVAPAPALGCHDVVVESPDHVASILDVDPAGWREVWGMCGERLAMLAARDDVVWAMLFKNSGPAAGASLEHVHSQLVALDFVPPAILWEMAATRLSADPFGAIIVEAEAAGRLVAEVPAASGGGAADGLVAIVPPAPRQPFETWIIPRGPVPYLHAASPGALAALADLTRSFVGRLERLVPGANYNWWLHQPPFAGRPAAPLAPGDLPRWRWHLEIVPRINGLAGFELGTGCHVTTLGPEDCARLLREAG